MELVKDRDARESFPKDAELAKKLGGVMTKRGLLGMRTGRQHHVGATAVHHEGTEVDHVVSELDDAIGELETVL